MQIFNCICVTWKCKWVNKRFFIYININTTNVFNTFIIICNICTLNRKIDSKSSPHGLTAPVLNPEICQGSKEYVLAPRRWFCTGAKWHLVTSRGAYVNAAKDRVIDYHKLNRVYLHQGDCMYLRQDLEKQSIVFWF